MYENNWLDRTEKLIGKEKLQKIRNSNIIIFGLGGVGSYAVEGLVRSGIENIAIVDKDTVDITNINRQLIATFSNIGMSKVKVEAERIKQINPSANVIEIPEFIDKNNLLDIMRHINNKFNTLKNHDGFHIDYVIDAIDTVSAKIALIELAKKMNIPIISAMGTGNKLDPTKFEITDIYKTTICPLAKVMRKELRKRGIDKLKVIYSKEEPIKLEESEKENGKVIPGSISFVPSVAGLMIAGEVIKDIIKEKEEKNVK